MADISTHTFSVIVDNKSGVLAKVVGMFSARGYNIESLTVAEVDEDRNLFTNYYKNQEDYFVSHRHDQGILSVIRKLEGSIEIDKNETWDKPFEIKCKNYPFWATRKPN